jgi:hypothetical protein
MIANQQNLNPKEFQQIQFSAYAVNNSDDGKDAQSLKNCVSNILQAYAANHSDDGKKTRHTETRITNFYLRDNSKSKIHPEEPRV